VKQRTPAEVLALVDERGVEFVDYRFCDLPGINAARHRAGVRFGGEHLRGRHGFDGSSIRGFQQIQESDMILLPDPSTAYIDPSGPARRSCSTPTSPIRSRSRTTPRDPR